MIPVTAFAGLPVAVLGLGRAGLASALALLEGGAHVLAWDDVEAARNQAIVAGVPVTDLSRCNWRELTTLVLSPGIPLHRPAPHPIVAAAREAGCEIVGEVELLARTERRAAYIGITGTNGKSTTTALLGHIFDVAGHPHAVGGNLGQPALDLESPGERGAYILEMSSYQLDLAQSVHFDAAVLLNVSPDHLERHGDLAGYIAAKRRIFRNQARDDVAIVGIDDESSAAVHDALRVEGGRRVIEISGYRPAAGGVYCRDGWLIDDLDGGARQVIDLQTVPTLPGRHNRQNAAAAYAAARVYGLREKTVTNAMATYPGLPHRQEIVPGADGIVYVNDSKATNPDAAVRALTSYNDIYWIAGGRAKEGGFDSLLPGLSGVRHALLIGEAAAEIAAFLEGRVPVTVSGDLEAAVRQARTLARGQGAGAPVVLFSPACASFDQFDNFERRGDAFRAIVTGFADNLAGPARISGGAA